MVILRATARCHSHVQARTKDVCVSGWLVCQHCIAVRAEKYLREVWPAITRALREHGIGCELNLVRAGDPAVLL